MIKRVISITLLLSLIPGSVYSQQPVTNEIYYGWRPPTGQTGATITLVGFYDNTTYTVIDLETNSVIDTGIIDRFGVISITPSQYFKVETSSPVMVYYGYDCCDFGGTTHYPAIDGHSYAAREFIVWIPVLSSANQFAVYALEDTTVNIFDSGGSTVETANLTEGQLWIPQNISARTVYHIVSTGNITLQSNSNNGTGSAPPLNQSSACDTDTGLNFFVGTRQWQRGAIAIFAYQDTTVNITRYSNNTAFSVNIQQGSFNYIGNLGFDYFTIESTGDIAVWHGDTEGGDNISYMGDDITINTGREGGREFYIHTQSHGAVVFAPEDDTEIYVDGNPVVTLMADGYYNLPANAFLHITTTKPVIIETSGGNSLNDWGHVLKPALRWDRDGDNINDHDEGGACGLTSPDTDGDGLIDSLDRDSDNDGIEDSIEAGDNNPDTDPVDTDNDGIPDFRDTDSDNDGVEDSTDNCRLLSNPSQTDNDGDGQGDACDEDDDNDGDPDTTDCAPLDPSINHNAQESCDGIDNNCNSQIDENFPDTDSDGQADCVDQDDDGDGIDDDQDNCPLTENPAQEDFDGDGDGDACDEDDDNDGDPDVTDCGPFDPSMYHGNTESDCDGKDNDCNGEIDEGFTDTDGDGMADCIDTDDDGDGVIDVADNCPLTPNPDQTDSDNDGTGDACEGDRDGDGIIDDLDNCPDDPNPDQEDFDGDGDGDTCDEDDDNDGDPDTTDCEPRDGSIGHTRVEICIDGIDNDCDGEIDDNDSDCISTDGGSGDIEDGGLSDISMDIVDGGDMEDLEQMDRIPEDLLPDTTKDTTSDTTQDVYIPGAGGGSGCSCTIVKHESNNNLLVIYLIGILIGITIRRK